MKRATHPRRAALIIALGLGIALFAAYNMRELDALHLWCLTYLGGFMAGAGATL